MFYPEANEERCEIALLLDVDPIGLTRGKKRIPKGSADLTQYVNDRPYVTSSFMSVAISRVLGTALAGKCADRPELVDTPIPIEVTLSALPSRNADLTAALFEPLGYKVLAERLPLDTTFPEWGPSRFQTLSLFGIETLRNLLRHLYVLIPVTDDYKHYWVGPDEVDKLVRKGEGWLESHPKKGLIARRYLRHRRSLAAQALARLLPDESADPDGGDLESAKTERQVERPLKLHEVRLNAVMEVLRDAGATSVLDLGCGEGKLVAKLLRQKWVERVTGIDVSTWALERAERRLRLDQLPRPVRERVQLLRGSVLYRDDRFRGYDAIAAVEVVEHLDQARLRAFSHVVFGHAKPRLVVITTPNREYNTLFPSLPAGGLRHPDHRFEWTREEFADWAGGVEQLGYSWTYVPLGDEDPELGAPSQMGVFTRDV